MAKTVYDKYYKKHDYFGKPYPGMIGFFKNNTSKGYVLDLGCGQGRDALFLGRLGYKVKGIDISKVGINQMNTIAKQENLNVVGEVRDIYDYPVTTEYDVVLLDSMLHFYKRDIEKETNLIKRISYELKINGILANFMISGSERECYLKRVLNDLEIEWEVLQEGYTDYPEANAKFHMYIIKKQSGTMSRKRTI